MFWQECRGLLAITSPVQPKQDNITIDQTPQENSASPTLKTISGLPAKELKSAEKKKKKEEKKKAAKYKKEVMNKAVISKKNSMGLNK